MEKEILFSETQRFRKIWLWAPLLATGAFFIFQDVLLLLNDARSMDREELFVSNALIILITLLIYSIRLDTLIKTDGVYVRFFPFVPRYRKFALEELSQVQIRQYSPIGDYGGWGLRFGFGNGKAYTISGNKGIQLVFTNGSRLLIGTQLPEAAAEALQRFGF